RDERRQLGVHDCPEPPVSLREAQQTVDRWIGQYKEGYFPPLTNLARLTEEVGELARELNHRLGAKTKKPEQPEGSLAMELAHILIVVICLGNSQAPHCGAAFRWLMRTGTARAARVVCLPVSHFALISPMRRFKPGSSAFRRLDFPTPD